MSNSSGLGKPHDETGRPLTRRELRQQRDAARAHEGRANDPTPASEPAPVPTQEFSLGLVFPPEPATARTSVTDPQPTTPPGGVSFGSLAGMFADARTEISAQATVLTVCTGNICRSPLAETLLRSSLDDLDLRVHSAGTHALVGQSMTIPAQQLAHDRGVNAGLAEAHRARLLTERLIDDADLVLTMTAEQRDYAVQMLPRRLHRVFPVREFARLAQGVTDAQLRRIASGAGADPRKRLAAVVESIAGGRGGKAAQNEDVVDPYRQPAEVYEQSAAQLTPALAEVERVIRAVLA